MPAIISNNFIDSAKSVAGQVSSTFNTVAGYTVSGAALAAALGNKSLASGLSKAGAASGMIGALLSLGQTGISSKFVDRFPRPAPIADLTPEETRGKRLAPPDSLTYPNDIGNFYIQFTFKSIYRETPITPKKELNEAVIQLPLPPNLVETFGMQYSDKQLGVLGLIAKSGVLDPELASKMSGNDQQAAIEAVKEHASKAADLVTKTQGGLQYLLRTAAGAVSDTAGAAVERVTGAVLNPFQALQFEGINLRKHTFNFRFSPNSEQDAYRLNEILRTFKIRMHPEKRDLLFNFPDICHIEFGDVSSVPYRFKPCYLETMSVNYAPQGTPAFFKQGLYPAEIELSLTFGEVEPITREFFELAGYDQYNFMSGGSSGSKPAPSTSEGTSRRAPKDVLSFFSGSRSQTSSAASVDESGNIPYVPSVVDPSNVERDR